MKYTISERTVTIETTEKGETLTKETVQALTERKATWEHIERLALEAPATPIDETPDPLEGIRYPEVPADLLAMEPANILPAE